MMRFVLALTLALSTACAAFAADTNPIGRFIKVTNGVYRGQRPEEAGIRYLAEMGVKTIVDVENDDDAVEAEGALATSLGLRFISRPMSGFWAPETETVNNVLAILADKANYPIFLHCQHGQDRTGLLVGLFRVEHQGWAPGKAYAEMREIGFHPELVFLNHYFEERTGFED